MLRAIRRYREAVPKLLSLSGREWRDLLVAQGKLVVAQFLVWTTPTGKLVATGNHESGGAQKAGERLGDARSLALAVGRAAEFGVFRPACLVRSIALYRLLQSKGLEGAQVQIGVIVQDGRLAAHAWVEYGGEILGDDPHAVAHFDTLPGLSLRDRPLDR